MTTMTREGNTVIVEHFNRYGSPYTRTMTYKKFTMRLEILKLRGNYCEYYGLIRVSTLSQKDNTSLSFRLGELKITVYYMTYH